MSTPSAPKGKGLVEDKRFHHVHTDPRFQRAAKADRKFTPDSRFQRMFTDKSFATNYTVDAFGRKQETGKENSELLKFYEMDAKTKEKVAGKADKKATGTPAAAATASSAAVAPAGPGGKLSQKQKAEAKAAAKKAATAAATMNSKNAKGAKKAVPMPVEPEEDDDDAAANDDDGEEPASDAGSDGFDGNYMSERGMAPPSSEEDDDAEEDDTIEEDDDDDVPVDGDNSTSSDSDLEADIEMEAAYEEEVIPTGDAETSRARRLAVMNLEWDRLGAVDLLVLFRSFIPQPANGTTSHPVRSVKVYPSEFGRQRMASEAQYGPTAIYAGGITEEQYKQRIQQKMKKVQAPLQEEEEDKLREEEDSERSSSDDDEDAAPGKRKRVSFPAGTKNSTKKVAKNTTPAATPAKQKRKQVDDEEEALREAEDDILSRPVGAAGGAGDDEDSDASSDASDQDANGGTEFDKEKLRQYELERLKYFYAIVDCDTPATAEALYRSCDGLEFEHSSNLIDLRYVPDEVTFTKEEEASMRDQASKVPSTYKAPEFYTQALQHTNVQLTWDRDDPVRSKLLQKKFQPEDEATADLKAYLGSDDEEDGYGSDAVTEASDSGSEDDQEDQQPAGGEDVEDGEDGEELKKPAKKKVTLKRKARAKYLALLQELKKPASDDDDAEGVDDNHEVSITFEPGLKALGETISTKMLNKDKEKAKEGESTWEKHLRERLEKKKEKKKLRKEKLKGAGGDAAEKTGAGEEDDSGDEIGGANARMESDLYDDDDVVMDEEDDFFKISDDDELEPPRKQTNQKHAKRAVEDNDDGSEVSMSSESGEEHMGDDSDASDNDDDEDIDNLRGQAATKRMFDESRPIKKPVPAKKEEKAVSAAANGKDGKKKLKRKRGDDDEDADGGAEENAEDSAKSRAELELLLMDETPDETARGYSLKTLLKQKKTSQLAAASGSSAQSKKARKALASGAVGGEDGFKVDTADSRFEGLFVDSAFAIDPTHPSFKSTAGTEQLLHEKAKRRQQQEEEKAKEIARRKEQAKKGAAGVPAMKGASASVAPPAAAAASSTGPSLASMVASIKRKVSTNAAAAGSKEIQSVKKAKSDSAPASKRARPDSNM